MVKPNVIDKPKNIVKPIVIDKPKKIVKPKIIDKPKTIVKPKIIDRTKKIVSKEKLICQLSDIKIHFTLHSIIKTVVLRRVRTQTPHDCDIKNVISE